MDFSSSFKAMTRGKKGKKSLKATTTQDEDQDTLDDVNRDLEDDNLNQDEVVIEIARNLTITTK